MGWAGTETRLDCKNPSNLEGLPLEVVRLLVLPVYSIVRS